MPYLHDAVVSVRKSFTSEELRLIKTCVPGGDTLEIFYTSPAYVVLRSVARPDEQRRDDAEG
jgi:hypothetical protein